MECFSFSLIHPKITEQIKFRHHNIIMPIKRLALLFLSSYQGIREHNASHHHDVHISADMVFQVMMMA